MRAESHRVPGDVTSRWDGPARAAGQQDSPKGVRASALARGVLVGEPGVPGAARGIPGPCVSPGLCGSQDRITESLRLEGTCESHRVQLGEWPWPWELVFLEHVTMCWDRWPGQALGSQGVVAQWPLILWPGQVP